MSLSFKRKKYLECEEYTKGTKKVDIVMSLSLGGTQQLYESYKCEYQSTGLVTGGVITKHGEFPHMYAKKRILRIS